MGGPLGLGREGPGPSRIIGAATACSAMHAPSAGRVGAGPIAQNADEGRAEGERELVDPDHQADESR